MKASYGRRALADGSTTYTKNGAAITEAEFYRSVPLARARELRTYQRHVTNHSITVKTTAAKRNAEDSALLELIAAKLRQ
jgi:hypothetical protein